ncbi:MAG: DEAD/DEAH box helicase [Gemmatimonadetes bacterium]|nr:DEAD/DEAH box helicase [Gemmatimonadota bacterium]
MSPPTTSTKRSPTLSISRQPSAKRSVRWPRIAADALQVVREPLRWSLSAGERTEPGRVADVLRLAFRGPGKDDWLPPSWLLPHQVDAARRIAGRLEVFHGALLADAVGLGKTYVALAVATRYQRSAVLAPPSLLTQWRRVVDALRVPVAIHSDHWLSRGRGAPAADLLIVDEAHRFRKSDTRRYHALAMRPGNPTLLLLTATPVVNAASDLVSLLELFLADNALAPLGLPSLRAAAARGDYWRIAHAASAVAVGRSPRVLAPSVSIPTASDSPVLPLPALELPLMARVLQLMGELRFPAVADRTAAALLALHLRHRLSSSVAACLETLRRHVVYLDRAASAAVNGERLSRRAARMLFGMDDELQLTLDLSTGPVASPIDAKELMEEKARLEGIIRFFATAAGGDPKASRLGQILAAREPRKTIVFTTAVATAHDLARRLGWRRVAVVSGRGAWIASGALPLEDALRLFAPAARGGTPPGAAEQVNVLLATDLASEGLDLQDADAVVHYDLPWNPLRLEQRVGRVARLGSTHHRVEVWWFVPPRELESDLALSRRISHKAREQLKLGVTVSSRVGRARILGTALAWREEFAARAAREPPPAPVHAVVAGPRAALLALEWCAKSWTIPEVVVIENGLEVLDEDRRNHLIRELIAAKPIDANPARKDLDCICALARRRLGLIDRLAADEQSRRLSRLVLGRAAVAARRRDAELLSRLDQILDRIGAGTNEGGKRRLAGALREHGCGSAELARWLEDYPRLFPGPWVVRLEAVLFGSAS